MGLVQAHPNKQLPHILQHILHKVWLNCLKEISRIFRISLTNFTQLSVTLHILMCVPTCRRQSFCPKIATSSIGNVFLLDDRGKAWSVYTYKQRGKAWSVYTYKQRGKAWSVYTYKQREKVWSVYTYMYHVHVTDIHVYLGNREGSPTERLCTRSSS